MKGFVSDIQKFSLYDVPGIRKAVFLKECELRVGGFSERFVNLPKETRREVLSRTIY